MNEPNAHARGLNTLFEFKYDGQKHLYYYNKKSGLWNKNGIHIMKQKMGFSFSSKAKGEVADYLKTKNFVEDLQFNNKKGILPLKDGVIKLPSMKFYDHKPDNMLTYSLPLYYNEKAVSKHIIPFIETTVKNPIDRWNLFAMIGYCFVRSTPYKAIFWILGQTNTGKSTFLEILSIFFGKLRSSVSVYDFDKAQYLEGLRGKMVNIEDELTSSELGPAIVNSLKWLSGSEVTKQGKTLYVNPRDIEVKPKIILGSNFYALPKEPDSAYLNRCVVIKFRHQFELSNKDNIIEKMTTKNEMSGLLNVALHHLKELNERGKFKKEYDDTSHITLGEVEG